MLFLTKDILMVRVPDAEKLKQQRDLFGKEGEKLLIRRYHCKTGTAFKLQAEHQEKHPEIIGES